jgi:hypothetical protein
MIYVFELSCKTMVSKKLPEMMLKRLIPPELGIKCDGDWFYPLE